MPFSALIFDLDGVIAETESVQLRAMNQILNPLGLSISNEEWAQKYCGHPIEEDVRTIHELFHLSIPLEAFSEQRRNTYRELVTGGVQLEEMTGLSPLLDELDARHIPYAIASGSPGADVLDVLRSLKLLDRFPILSSGDEVARPKPAPDVYLRAAEILQVRPAQCVALEDSASGIAAAKAAGMRVIAMPSLFTRYQDLSAADASVKDLEEARKILISGKL